MMRCRRHGHDRSHITESSASSPHRSTRSHSSMSNAARIATQVITGPVSSVGAWTFGLRWSGTPI